MQQAVMTSKAPPYECGPHKGADMFLRDLAMVQRAEVRFRNEVKTWYFNMTDSVSATLKKIGMSGLFKEETRLAG